MFTCYRVLLAFVLLPALVMEVHALRKQGVAVRGQLLCGSRPASETKVRIVDIDTGLQAQIEQINRVVYASLTRAHHSERWRQAVQWCMDKYCNGPDPDDTLDEKMLDADGKFELNGSTRELTDIDPVLYVWTDCDDGVTPCQRKITFKIPKKFIHNGTPKPEQWVDIGILNLQGHFEEEGRECLH